MRARTSIILSLSLALAALCAVGCVKDSMTTVVQANRYGQFAVAPGQKVAVLTFTGYKGSGLADLVSIEFLRHGVDVVERNVLDRVVGEVRRTEAGAYNNDLSDADVLRQIGKITEADFVVCGDTDAIDPDTIRFLRDDFGRQSPRFSLSYARVSLRVFSTKTGEVSWWGTTEATIEGPWGNNVRLMDHLRMAARRAVDSMMGPQVNTFSKRVVQGEIPLNQGPLVAYGTPPGAAVAQPPPPVASAPSPAAAPGAQKPCSKDKDCPGDLVCAAGACKPE
jgi:hypothetical protein